MKETTIYNQEKESEEAIKEVLKRAQDLFRDHKELIINNLFFYRDLQALTMTGVLPSYVELVRSLGLMAMVFEVKDKPIAKDECERLMRYLVFCLKENK